jgi:hypothetical protein
MSASVLERALSEIIPARGRARRLALTQLAGRTGDDAYYVCAALFFTRVVGLSPVTMGLGWTIAWTVSLVLGVPLGTLADRKGPRQTAVWFSCCAGLGAGSYLFARSAASSWCSARPRTWPRSPSTPSRFSLSRRHCRERLWSRPVNVTAPSAVGIRAQQCALLYLGRLIAQKQPEFWTPHLYLVGWGDATAHAQLRAVAADLRVAERVHFADHAAAAERNRWLAAADMLLLPSSAENFSLVLVEAVAAGMPAIVSPHIGVLEFLRPEDARVVPLQPRAWAVAIEETAAAPPVRDGTAFRRVREQFSSVNLVPRWLELYRELPAFASPVG